VPSAPQQAPHWQSDLARKIVGLIESALEQTKRMERDRHHGIGAFQHIQSRPAHQTGQRFRELPPAFELERVDQFAK